MTAPATSPPAAPAPAGESPPPDPATPPGLRPRRSRRGWRFRGTWLKASAGVALYRLAAVAPRPAVLLLFRALLAVLRLLRRMPGNPLLASARDLARIAARRGRALDPRAIYHGYLDQVAAIGPLFLEVLDRGPAPAAARTTCPPEELAMVRALAQAHGGLVVAVPHNVGAVYSSIWMASVLPTVLVVKNQRLPRLEAIARQVFARMGVEVAFVRDLSAIELTRVAIKALREGKVLVATLDLVQRGDTTTTVPIFDAEVGLGHWAYRFAARAKAPVVPGWIELRPGGCVCRFRPALAAGTPEEMTAAFALSLERSILDDPSSWAMLLDKRWREVLRQGARAARAGP